VSVSKTHCLRYISLTHPTGLTFRIFAKLEIGIKQGNIKL